jgi:indole-3-glycerol phosphate synthase
VLLIAAVLSPAEIREYLDLCAELDLDGLVEAHTGDELDRALASGAEIVGINNRDLRTFETDLQTTIDLIDHVPEDILLVSESGIRNRSDVERLRDAGADAVLVGETLVREPDVGNTLRDLLGRSTA